MSGPVVYERRIVRVGLLEPVHLAAAAEGGRLVVYHLHQALQGV